MPALAPLSGPGWFLSCVHAQLRVCAIVLVAAATVLPVATSASALAPVQSFPLTGCPASGFLLEVRVGAVAAATPFRLMLDTGSVQMAVAAADCASCTGVAPLWTSTNGSESMGVNASQLYMDHTGWEGDMWTDGPVQITSEDGTEWDTSSMRMVAIRAQSTQGYTASGEADAQSSVFFAEDQCSSEAAGTVSLQGIVGFALPSANRTAAPAASFLQQLWESHPTMPQVFALQLCVQAGRLWMGGHDPTVYTGEMAWTPLSDGTMELYTVNVADMSIGGVSLGLTHKDFTHNGPSVLDSGTALWALPSSVYTRVVSALLASTSFRSFFRHAPAANFFNSRPANGDLCELALDSLNDDSEVSAARLQREMPTITVTMEDGMSITMDAVGSYLLPCGSDYRRWTSGLVNSSRMIGGWPLLNQFVVAHDVGGQRVGFAPRPTSRVDGGCDTGLGPLHASAVSPDSSAGTTARATLTLATGLLIAGIMIGAGSAMRAF